MKELKPKLTKVIRAAAVALSLILISLVPGNAQPVMEWSRSFGGSADDIGMDIQQTFDGGFVMISTSDSNDGDLIDIGNDPNFRNIWLVKTSIEGDILWQKLIGGNGDESASSIIQTLDEGFLVVGTTSSNDDVVSENFGSIDIWVVKLNALGEIEWEKSFGGSDDELGVSGIQDTNGDFVVSGFSNSVDGHMTGNNGSFDGFVVKLNIVGEILWQKIIGSEGFEATSDIAETADGGYIVSGIRADSEGTIATNDIWIVKLSNDGSEEWERTYGGSSIDRANSVQSLADGSYILVGSTSSNDGDISQNLGGQDVWVLKLDNEGDIIWENTYGGSSSEAGRDIQKTSDGGFVIAGFTSSWDGDVDPINDFVNYWVLKLDGEGNINWEYSLGGLSSDDANMIRQTSDGGFIVGGSSRSDSGDVIGHHGEFDFWVVKLAAVPLSIRENVNQENMTIYPNPNNGQFSIRSTNVSGNFNIEVLDISGRLVHAQNSTLNVNSSIAVNVENITSGVYMVKIVNALDNSVSSHRIIKQ